MGDDDAVLGGVSGGDSRSAVEEPKPPDPRGAADCNLVADPTQQELGEIADADADADADANLQMVARGPPDREHPAPLSCVVPPPPAVTDDEESAAPPLSNVTVCILEERVGHCEKVFLATNLEETADIFIMCPLENPAAQILRCGRVFAIANCECGDFCAGRSAISIREETSVTAINENEMHPKREVKYHFATDDEVDARLERSKSDQTIQPFDFIGLVLTKARKVVIGITKNSLEVMTPGGSTYRVMVESSTIRKGDIVAIKMAHTMYDDNDGCWVEGSMMISWVSVNPVCAESGKLLQQRSKIIKANRQTPPSTSHRHLGSGPIVQPHPFQEQPQAPPICSPRTSSFAVTNVQQRPASSGQPTITCKSHSNNALQERYRNVQLETSSAATTTTSTQSPQGPNNPISTSPMYSHSTPASQSPVSREEYELLVKQYIKDNQDD
ncbi:hypothetical protein Pelo_13986 [Pelomyxa schiedti]|nr:hypothetical protein Pelo_13986 [Pelomyxa schiedti]